MAFFLLSSIIGGVFTISAVPKLLAPRRTARDVQNYRILLGTLATVYGWALGPFQLAAGLSLISGYGARWGALTVLVLLVTFMAAIAIAIYRKQNLACTCFGLLYRERVGWVTERRDGVLAVIALAVLFSGPGAPPFGEMVAGGSALELAGALLRVVTLIFALGLGWVAAKGWPRWFVRVRHRNMSRMVEVPPRI